MKPFPGEHEEAKRHPNGFVYRIDGNFAFHEPVPPERIIGAWTVDEAGKINGKFVPNPNYMPSPGRIRNVGVKKVVAGGGIFTATICAFYQLAQRNLVPNDPHLLLLAGIPFAWFCAGLIECISGAPFKRLASGWMNLQGWQRGVIGTLLILICMVVILCLGTLIGMHM